MIFSLLLAKFKSKFFSAKMFSTGASKFKHFELEIRDQVAIVRFDTPNSKVKFLTFLSFFDLIKTKFTFFFLFL